MRNGYPTQTQVDEWIRGDPGVKASVLHQAYAGSF
jgi:hypothetical protein